MSEYRKTMEVVDGIERVCNRAIWGRLSHLASCFSFYCEHFRTDRYHKKLDGSKLARLVAGMGPGRGTAWWQDNIANAVGIKKQKFQKMQTRDSYTKSNMPAAHRAFFECGSSMALVVVSFGTVADWLCKHVGQVGRMCSSNDPFLFCSCN